MCYRFSDVSFSLLLRRRIRIYCPGPSHVTELMQQIFLGDFRLNNDRTMTRRFSPVDFRAILNDTKASRFNSGGVNTSVMFGFTYGPLELCDRFGR